MLHSLRAGQHPHFTPKHGMSAQRPDRSGNWALSCLKAGSGACIGHRAMIIRKAGDFLRSANKNIFHLNQSTILKNSVDRDCDR